MGRRHEGQHRSRLSSEVAQPNVDFVRRSRPPLVLGREREDEGPGNLITELAVVDGHEVADAGAGERHCVTEPLLAVSVEAEGGER